ncbi:MAG: 16S rRNA (guanine(527)-N(7))-methyltransferase RsmG [Anaerolineae bacterium]|nr:16S rRNA (guanine(527)-N(7))-methyltransferase RsmG [Anaerolineae bacterium]
MDEMPILRAAARDLGLALTDAQVRAFQRHWQELVEWNRRFNLTTVTDYEAAQVRHFLDSLLPLVALREAQWAPPPGCEAEPHGQRFLVCDIGSGAGFPGVPLKVVCPSWHVVLVESVGKKARFLQHLVQALSLEGAQVEHARAEELGRRPAHRERYHLVVARAVADLRVLAEYALPLLQRGGVLAAHKGSRAEQEVWEAKAALRILGGEVHRILTYELPGVVEPRRIVLVAKRSATPPQYPRRPGIPQKRPLGGR